MYSWSLHLDVLHSMFFPPRLLLWPVNEFSLAQNKLEQTIVCCWVPLFWRKMKSAWGPDLYNMAAWDESQVTHIDLFEFKELLLDDTDGFPWDKEMEADLAGG